MTFQPNSLLEKLSKLNASQQSIETISQWCLFYRKDAKKVVATWEQDFARSQDQDKKLALVYLANDILQNSRRKGPQFVNEFYHKLPAAIRHILKHGDAKKRSSLARMIQVWDERRVFGTGGAKPFKELLQPPSGKLSTGSLGSKGSGQIASPPALAPASSIGLPELDPLQRLLSGALAAHSRSRELSTRSNSLLSQEVTGNLEVLEAGQRQLGELKSSLELELSQRQQTLDILRGLITQQERDVSRVQGALAACDARLAQIQEQLISSEPATATAMSEDVYSPGSAVPPADAAWVGESPPPPPFSPVNGDAAEAPKDYLPEELPAGEPPGPSQPDGGMSDGNGQADTSLEDLLAGFGEGGADVSSAAADLVAQLTGSGGQSAQMLMEALSALPKEDVQMPQQEPKDAFVPEEEEYDPEYGL